MKFPNWFKILWLIVLIVAFVLLFIVRFSNIMSGEVSFIDIVGLLILVCLLLSPLFSEIDLFGVKLKHEIKSIKEQIDYKFSNIQTLLASNVHSEVSPKFYFPYPAAETDLDKIREITEYAVDQVYRQLGDRIGPELPSELNIPDDVQVLFRTRFNLEGELRRIFKNRIDFDQQRRYISVTTIIRELVNAEYIHPSLAQAIREVYSICSPGIHAEYYTDNQVSFVREMGPELIGALRKIV